MEKEKENFFSIEKQKEMLLSYGVDQILVEEGDVLENQTTGLDNLLLQLQPGDEICVAQFHRLGRSKPEIEKLVQFFTEKQAKLRALDLPIGNPDICSVSDLLVWFTIQYESVRTERYYTGVKRYALRGGSSGRRTIINEELKKQISDLLGYGFTKKDVAERLQISPNTLYKVVAELKKERVTKQITV